jgi:heat shock protein HtpX
MDLFNSNTVKTAVLLAALTGLFVLIGAALGGQTGMIFAFALAIAMNMGAWWFSDSLALTMSHAREVSERQAPELHQMVETLAMRAGIPKPRVYVIDTPMPNAFATGRSPEKGAVAVTTGIMQVLNTQELAGVLAHELSHIKHRDTLIASVVATLAGAITMLAQMAQWALLFGGYGGRSERGEGGGVGSAIAGLLMILLAPIAALLIQMAISRSREYGADASGAQILGDPLPLANGLVKLETAMQRGLVANVNPAAAHLYIVNPLHGGIGDLFRTHPSTADRVARLRAMRIG